MKGSVVVLIALAVALTPAPPASADDSAAFYESVPLVSLVGGVDVSGWQVIQEYASHDFTFPVGTVIPPNGYLVIARNAEKSAFEAFWGITLGADVVFVNSGETMPMINGSEIFTLLDPFGEGIDGPTLAVVSTASQNLQRIDPCTFPDLEGSWAVDIVSAATPGSGAGIGCGTGMVINEIADASGTGNYVYEFLELHYDAPAGLIFADGFETGLADRWTQP